MDYYDRHQEIIKLLEKKTAPYIAHHIHSYAFGKKFDLLSQIKKT